MNKRTAKQILIGQEAVDGAGVHLRRVIGLRNVHDFDPFLMLDGFDSTNPEDYIKGFPWHPHRGIETITYLIQGEIIHGDNLGNKGIVRDLECQWMTAGSGIIHQEMPQPKDKMLGCQLWVNLPAKNKMTQPAYKDITEKDVKIVNEENAIIRIISGNYQGFSGAFTGNFVKVQYLDITLNPEKVWNYSESPNDETLFIYLLDGSLAVDNQLEHFEQKSCAILFASSNRNPDEKEQMTVKAGEEGARFILLSAKPLNEPIAWGGPIVMNTRDELNLAFEELDNGTFIKHP